MEERLLVRRFRTHYCMNLESGGRSCLQRRRNEKIGKVRLHLKWKKNITIEIKKALLITKETQVFQAILKALSVGRKARLPVEAVAFRRSTTSQTSYSRELAPCLQSRSIGNRTFKKKRSSHKTFIGIIWHRSGGESTWNGRNSVSYQKMFVKEGALSRK